MPQETLNLELCYKNQAGKTKKIIIKDPKTDLDRETAERAVNTIANTEIFDSEAGDPYAVGTGARYVRRSVTDIYQVEA